PLSSTRRAAAYTAPHDLSLPDALPIYPVAAVQQQEGEDGPGDPVGAQHVAGVQQGRVYRPEEQQPDVAADQHRPSGGGRPGLRLDRKSTRLNSSHVKISYAVFCLIEKK